ncbi:2'-5' RNA ligase family protein [Promicromonospora sp. NPDC057138]|uniref:2'-5' RNA ligase family protein n=1 Tax=Promicromonospora sp. NPDC057138 TaxID=3346031 RepID=UPI0036422989
MTATPEQTSFEIRWARFQELDKLTDHWWWRPGWHVGRKAYTWHITFDNATAGPLHDLVDEIQPHLEGPGLDPIPKRWLHLTMQGVGFTDEVSDEDLTAIADAATARLAHVLAFDMTLGPADADAEGTGLLITPWAAVAQVRDAVRAGIGDVWANVPEDADGFRPHVSVAYSNAALEAGLVRDRVARLREITPVTIPITSVQLIRLNRDEKVYVWDVVRDVPLAPAS